MRGAYRPEELLVLRAEALQAAIIRQRCQHLSGKSWRCEGPARPVPCLCSRGALLRQVQLYVSTPVQAAVGPAAHPAPGRSRATG